MVLAEFTSPVWLDTFSSLCYIYRRGNFRGKIGTSNLAVLSSLQERVDLFLQVFNII